MNLQITREPTPHPTGKFENPDLTAKGEPRAVVGLHQLETLWFNTGTLCNIECANCYILSSPTNDSLVYLSTGEVVAFLDEIKRDGHATREIAFTGGEPFMCPDMLDILEETLARGFQTLVLSNAMQPMQRPRIKEGLLRLAERYRDQLLLRISLDHYDQPLHEQERGAGTWAKALAGIDW
ncbi:MAG: radical SAM protein, partial [Pseudomonadota bacterium]